MTDSHGLPDGLVLDPELLAREQRRQSALMQALLDPTAPLPAGWQEQGRRALDTHTSVGLQAYRGNAAAHAGLALIHAYPVLARLVSEDTLKAMAARFWRVSPPVCGDLGEWGQGLGGWLDTLPELAEWPWLADVARLEWRVHSSGRSAQLDADQAAAHGIPGLALLADHDPAGLHVHFVPGLSCWVSRWPVADIWLAHQPEEGEGGLSGEPPSEEMVSRRLSELTGLTREPAVAEPSPAGHGMLVFRQGWQVGVRVLPGPLARLTQALADGQSIGQALSACPDADFEDWLIQALQGAWLAGVSAHPIQHDERR